MESYMPQRHFSLVILFQRGGRGERLWLPLAIFVLALLIECGLGAKAQAQTGPRPGASDPVGAPAYYTSLRSDDLMIGQLTYTPTSQFNYVTSYQVDSQNRLSSQISVGPGTGPFGTGSSYTASGHIFGQNNDILANVGRGPDNTVDVSFPQSGTRYFLPGLHASLANTPDQIAVAVGDLDKVPDENGINYDEVAIAYLTGNLGTNGIKTINLAVLNYTNVNAVGNSPRFVT